MSVVKPVTKLYSNKKKTQPGRQTGEFRGAIHPMAILTRRKRVLNTGYSLPDIFRSYEEYQRFHNQDLQNMDDFSLWQEELRVKMAIAYIDPEQQPELFTETGEPIPAIEWLKSRYIAIRTERKRRERIGV